MTSYCDLSDGACPQCGFECKAAIMVPCGLPPVKQAAVCKAAIEHQRKKPGLGDIVKSGLSAIGITEERVSKALGKPCGCGKRAEKLNELGKKFGIG